MGCGRTAGGDGQLPGAAKNTPRAPAASCESINGTGGRPHHAALTQTGMGPARPLTFGESDMRKGSKKKSVKLSGTEPWKQKAKKPGNDNKPSPMRPAAHSPKQAAQAKRTKRLSGVML
jgi:hypothetical protein